MKVIFFLMMATISSKLCSQIENKSIYIDLIDKYYMPFKLQYSDTLKLKNDRKIIIKMIDFQGEFSFQLYQKGKLVVQGKYCNSLATFKKYGTIFNDKGESRIDVEEYYFPLKDSVWTEYDSKKKIYINTLYEKGIKK